MRQLFVLLLAASLLACGDDDRPGSVDMGTDDMGADSSAGDAGLTNCGDSIVDEGEDGDDSNTIDFDGCNSDCRVTSGLRWQLDLDFDPTPESGWLFRGMVEGPDSFCAVGKVNGFDFADSGSLLICTDFEGNIVRRQAFPDQGTPFWSFVQLPSGDFIALTGSFGSEGTTLFHITEAGATQRPLPEGLQVFELEVVGEQLLAVGRMGATLDDATGWVGFLNAEGRVVETLHTNADRPGFYALALANDGRFYASSRGSGFGAPAVVSSFNADGSVLWETDVPSAGGGDLLVSADTARFFYEDPSTDRLVSTLAWFDASGASQGSVRLPGQDELNIGLAPNDDTLTLSFREVDDANTGSLRRLDPDGNERWTLELPNDALRYFEPYHLTVLPNGVSVVVGAEWRRGSAEVRWGSPRPQILAFDR